MALDLTIIVPAYNEATRLQGGMDRLGAAVDRGAVDLGRTEILVVDDGSTDGTADTAGKLLATFPHHRVVSLPANRGKGAAVRAGIAASRTPACAYMDADMAIDPRAVPLLLDGLRSTDIAIGSRALPGSMVESRYLVRSVMGGLFNRLVTAGTGLGLHDTQCGFKAFRTPVARLLFHLVRIDGFAFDVEVLARAAALGLTVTQVPVQWKHVPGSTVHPLHDSLGMLADVYRSRLGLRAVPPVPAITVRPRQPASPPTVAAVRAAVGDALAGTPLPIVATGDAVVVLGPLLDPTAMTGLTGALSDAFGGMAVRRRSMSWSELRKLAPLAGIADPASGDPTADG